MRESCYMVLASLLLLVMRPLALGKRCMRNAESKQNENNNLKRKEKQIMKYRLFNDELGCWAPYEFDNLNDATHEAAIKCRKHSVWMIDEEGKEHKMFKNWETMQWELPSHQVNQHIYADGSWFYTITEYGKNTSQINVEDDDCPFYGDKEVKKENFCICCGNEKSCEEFVAWEEYGMFLER